MPMTRKFALEELKGIEFFGFNKVGDNTRDNLFPLLTGQAKQKVTEVEFIWKSFEKRGFWTVYGEDWVDPFSLTFNFDPRPTDHFYQPFAKALDKTRWIGGVRPLWLERKNNCFGDLLAGEKIYEWYEVNSMIRGTMFKKEYY
jgi:hypothetical protein